MEHGNHKKVIYNKYPYFQKGLYIKHKDGNGFFYSNSPQLSNNSIEKEFIDNEYYYCLKVAFTDLIYEDGSFFENIIIVEKGGSQFFYKRLFILPIDTKYDIIHCEKNIKTIVIHDPKEIESIKSPIDIKSVKFPAVIPYTEIKLSDKRFNYCFGSVGFYISYSVEKSINCTPKDDKLSIANEKFGLKFTAAIDWFTLYLDYDSRRCMDYIKRDNKNFKLFITKDRLSLLGVSFNDVMEWFSYINDLGLSQINFLEEDVIENSDFLNSGEGYMFELVFKGQNKWINYFIMCILRYILVLQLLPFYKETIKQVKINKEDFFKALLLANSINIMPVSWNIHYSGEIDLTLTLEKYIQRILCKNPACSFTSLITVQRNNY